MTSVLHHLDLVRIETVCLKDIPVAQPFFDSLRLDYFEFDSWYHKVAMENRQAWVVRTQDKLSAVCIFKIECAGEKITDDGTSLPGHFLKLCTLKVAQLGVKYGERLLYAAFAYAILNDLTAIYVQVRKGAHNELVSLLKEFGFCGCGMYKQDMCYVKQMRPGKVCSMLSDPVERFDYARKYYPYHYDGADVGKYIVSLSMEEHELLFPDACNQRLMVPVENRPLIGELNAMRKMFVRNVGIKNLRIGDLLFFYQKGRGRKIGCSIECMGMVESVCKYKTLQEIPVAILQRLPDARTFIDSQLARSRYVLVVNFRLIPTFGHGVLRRELTANGFEPNHRDVRLLPNAVYQGLFKGRLNRFGVN